MNAELYLATPETIPSSTEFMEQLRSVLAAAPVAAVCIVPSSFASAEDHERRSLVAEACGIVQAADAAAIIDGDPDLAMTLTADGVHTCADGPTVADCRRLTGTALQIGYSARFSRHAAMEAGQDGADYILFGRRHLTGDEPAELLDLIGWWSDLMTLPCVAFGDMTPDRAAEAAAAGADFIIPNDEIWQDPQGLEAFASALRLG